MSETCVTIPLTYKQYLKPENAFLHKVEKLPGKVNDFKEYYASVLANQYLNRIKADYYCFIADVWEKTWGNCLKNSFAELNSREFNAKKYINYYVWDNKMFHRAFRINDEKNLWIGSCTWRPPQGGVYLGLWFGEYAPDNKEFYESKTRPKNWEEYKHIDKGYYFWHANASIDSATNLMALDKIDPEPLRAAAEEVLQNYR